MKKIKLAVSPEEKEMIYKLRKEEESKLPKKVGYVKENIYLIKGYTNQSWFASESQKKEIINDFLNNNFQLIVPIGEKFVCYIVGKKELWYSDNGELAEMTSDWAKKYLVKISPIKK